MEFKGKVIAMIEKSQRKVSEGRNGKYAIDWFVVEETEGQYPSKAVFEVFSNEAHPRWSQFGLQLGQVVTVSFDVDAREYNGKWYNSIRAYKVEQEGASLMQTATSVVNEVAVQQSLLNNPQFQAASQPAAPSASVAPPVVTPQQAMAVNQAAENLPF